MQWASSVVAKGNTKEQSQQKLKDMEAGVAGG